MTRETSKLIQFGDDYGVGSLFNFNRAITRYFEGKDEKTIGLRDSYNLFV